jgi:hypothetical protein
LSRRLLVKQFGKQHYERRSNEVGFQPTGEATGFIPAPGNNGKPITVIGTAAIRDAFDAKSSNRR